MNKLTGKHLLKIFGIITALALVAIAAPIIQPEEALAAPWPARVVWNIYATDGWVPMADGVPMYLYGYIGGQAGVPLTFQDYGLNAMGNMPRTIATGAPTPTAGPVTTAEQPLQGHAQLPGPVIYARTGDIIEVRLKNLGTIMGTPSTPNDPHTIHWHGVDNDAAMDGVPETSVAALPANVPGNPGAGNIVVYEFTVPTAGTYMYHCHQEASIHVEMGMYGALIIYNPRDAAAATGPGMGQGGQLFGHKYDSDYVMLLTEIDPNQHIAEYNPAAPPLVMGAGIWNVVWHFPSYWLINGLSFPNTIHAVSLMGGAAWVYTYWAQSHPNWETFIQGSVNAKFGRGEKVLVRMINLGFQPQPMHVHGFHPKLIGMDQRAWTFGNPPGITAGQGLELNTFNIASGNTMELLFDFGTQKTTGNYSTQTYSRTNAAGAPVLNTDTTGLGMPDPFSGIVLPAGDYIMGPSVPNLYPWHNHDDYKSTNFGIYPGGQFTMVNVLP